MITIHKNAKVMIWGSTPEVRTGGAEMLNMLAAYLKSLGVNAKMFNWNINAGYVQGDYYKALYDINCGTWEEIEDTETTVIVLPDVMIEYFVDEKDENTVNALSFAKRYQHAQIIVWWMSTGCDFSCIRRRTLAGILKSFKHILHAYEPSLVRKDLEFYGIDEFVPLQHGTNPIYYNYVPKHSKSNTIFYNGCKHSTRDYVEHEIMPRINSLRPDILFETVNFDNGTNSYKSKEELCDIYDRCKVYIDFCEFVGRELMPREACLRDCIVILGKEGNAELSIDYPLKPEYKVNKNDQTAICNLIIDCIDNYDTRIHDFSFFKNKCLLEPKKWKWEVYNIFGPAIKKPFDE